MLFNKKIKMKVLIFTLFAIFISSTVLAQNGNDIVVIPIKGEINKATYQFVKEELEEVATIGVRAVIFDIDTYGGYIDQANAIKDLIIGVDVPTIAFVNNKAESAGVIITIACEKIVLAEGATIGSAETIPNTEKIMSMWVSQLESVANLRGRDPKIVAAMADKDIEIEGVVEKGELLNLNYKEAKDLGFIDLVANNYNDILDDFNIEYDEIITIEKDFKTKLAQFVVNPYIATLLLALGFIGLVIEVLTPGFAAGGTISLISFALFFGGNFLAGNSNLGAIIIFIAGIVLLLIEAVIPGFGVPGIGGIVCIVISIIIASESPQVAVISLGIAIILTVITAVVLIKFGARSPYLDKIILSTKQENKTGYISTVNYNKYLNKEGFAKTTLRPAGTIIIDRDRIDAVSEGDFIMQGDKVKVIKIEGRRVVVRKI